MVTTLVSFDLLLPVPSVRFRPRATLSTASMTVPETSMYERDRCVVPKDKIRSAWQLVGVLLVFDAGVAQQSRQYFLRTRFLASDGLHNLSAFGFREGVHAVAFFFSSVWLQSNGPVIIPQAKERFLKLSNQRGSTTAASLFWARSMGWREPKSESRSGLCQ